MDEETFGLFWETLRLIVYNVVIFNPRTAASSGPVMVQIYIYSLIKKKNWHAIQ